MKVGEVRRLSQEVGDVSELADEACEIIFGGILGQPKRDWYALNQVSAGTESGFSRDRHAKTIVTTAPTGNLTLLFGRQTLISPTNFWI
jgi:hypothetical protein